MTEPRPGRRPLADLLNLLWRQPLLAVPFGLFFGLLEGATPRAFRAAYLVSAVFSYCIGIALWVADHVLAPRLLSGGRGLYRGGFPRHALLYTGSSVVGAYVAALLVHAFLMPGFLGSVRSVLLVTAFTLLFTTLVSGIVYAWQFYQTALSRVRSEEEMNLARRIQRGFLLTAFPARPRIQVHAVNLSSREVSGDFYDVVPTPDGGFVIAIADVSGKGVPAALLSSMLQASLRTQAAHERSTAAMLRNLNELVCGSTSRQQFATFFLARIDERELTLRYSNAGHNPPLLLRRGAAPRPLERGGTVVGMLEDLAFEEETVALAPGDRVVLYTDGLSEAVGENGAMFEDTRVAEAAQALPADLSAEEICNALLDRLRAWLGRRDAGDDVTVMALRVLDAGAAAAPPAGAYR
jgi:hypothetical protein